MHLLSISSIPVTKGRTVDFGISWTTEGDIVRVQEHLSTRFSTIDT